MESYVNGSWVREEMEGVALPDKRFSKNIICVTEHLADNVGKSFSAACGELLRKSAWRLFSSQELSLLEVHQQKTLQRCSNQRVILIAEDTTDLSYFQKQKQGLGPLGGPKRMNVKGLNIHTAMALTTEGAALGIVHQKIWAPSAGRDKEQLRYIPIEHKESFKWIEVLRAANTCFSKSNPNQDQDQTVILIGDREADFFEHYVQPRTEGVEMLVRVRELNRNILYKEKPLKIKELLPRLKSFGKGEVMVKRHGPGQKDRIATVNYYSAQVVVPPTYGRKLPAQVMTLVYVKEQYRKGADAVNWVLITTLPVEGLDDATTMALYYTRRWVVERFHLILKSGLGVEKLQIDTFLRLHNALQLYSLIGWHLLWLYRLGQSVPLEGADQYFQSDTIEILAVVSGKQIVVVKDFILELGKLGGFIPTKKQPLPGEKTLWIGLRQFIALTAGFMAAKQKYGTG